MSESRQFLKFKNRYYYSSSSDTSSETESSGSNSSPTYTENENYVHFLTTRNNTESAGQNTGLVHSDSERYALHSNSESISTSSNSENCMSAESDSSSSANEINLESSGNESTSAENRNSPMQIVDLNQSEDDDFSFYQRPAKKLKTKTFTRIDSQTPEPECSTEINDDSGQNCPICFEPWSNAGDHRIATLKCGHLFGKNCIEKWIKTQKAKCPQCNKKATKKDVILVYASTIQVQDTAEKENLLKQLAEIKKEKEQQERENAKLRMQVAVDSQKLKHFQNEVQDLSYKCTADSNAGTSQMSVQSPKLIFIQRINLINNDGSCRVMAYSEPNNLLVVSLLNPSNMFPDYGVKKINTFNFKVEKYIPLHSKQIRDICFHEEDTNLLLSVSLDKKAKLTNLKSNATVATFETEISLWCCCWHPMKSSEFFVGTARGDIYHFNTAQSITEHIHKYEVPGSGGIVSLTYIPPYNNDGNDNDFYKSGLLVTRLTCICFLEIENENKTRTHTLNMFMQEGPFSHTAYDPISKHILTTCRPNTLNSKVRYILYELIILPAHEDQNVSNAIIANEIHKFYGSKTMKILSRNCLYSPNGFGLNAIFSKEGEKEHSVEVHDVSSLAQKIPTRSLVIDIMPIKIGKNFGVALLDDKKLNLFKEV